MMNSDNTNPYSEIKNLYPLLYQSFEILDEYQKDAVLDNHQFTVVKAHYGSGKTTVLIHRILYLHIFYGFPLETIFCLTFTNKAADEILERLKAVGVNYSEKDVRYFGTFHSVAKRLLEEHLPLQQIGYKKGFTILDAEDLSEYISRIISVNKLNIKHSKKIIKRIERYKKNGSVLYWNMKHEDDLEKLLYILKEEKKKDNVMDFDDLIDHAYGLLYNNHNINFCKCIIIDEAQDCDIKQINMIVQVYNSQTGVFVVGDQNQSIYSWRESELWFFEGLQNACLKNLVYNYRSTDNILEVAKVFLTDSQHEDIQGNRGSGNPITIKKHHNAFQEAMYLADRIKHMVGVDCRYKDIGIFYRRHYMSQAFERVFKDEGIPYEKSLKRNIRDVPVLYWFICLLKSCVNPSDTYSLNKVLLDDQFGPFNSEAEMKKILTKPTGNHEGLILKNKIQSFTSVGVKVDDLYGYFDLDKRLKPNSADYETNKDYIRRLIEKFKAERLDSSLGESEFIKEYVNNAALYGSEILDDQLDMDQDSVKLMTLHASKGLEFKQVFIVGANDGIIPTINKSNDHEKEEMRLFYVGITRAKDELEISYYTSPERRNNYVSKRPSRFIDMIPSNLKKIVDEDSEEIDLDDLVKKLWNDQKSDQGIKVRHGKYGIGYLISRENDMITVQFEGYGEKVLMESLVELEYL